MSPLIRQLQDGDKHQRLLRKESRLVVQLTSIRQKQTYHSGSELSWLALRLAEKISGHSLNQSEVNQNNRDSLAVNAYGTCFSRALTRLQATLI